MQLSLATKATAWHSERVAASQSRVMSGRAEPSVAEVRSRATWARLKVGRLVSNILVCDFFPGVKIRIIIFFYSFSPLHSGSRKVSTLRFQRSTYFGNSRPSLFDQRCKEKSRITIPGFDSTHL